MAAPEGIEGVDLVELRQISRERLPAVAADFDSARQLVSGFSGKTFARPGNVGVGPEGPAAAYVALSEALQAALSESSTNLHDTASAIGQFLDEILEADAGARERMNRAQAEADGVPYTGVGS